MPGTGRFLPSSRALLFLPLLLVTVPAVLPAQGGSIPVHREWGGRMLSSDCQTDASGVLHLWVGEDGGRIRHGTRPPGATTVVWSEQSAPAPVRSSIYGISFLSDALHGWAVTETGEVLETSNGGANWSVRSKFTGATGNPLPLYDVFFFDTLNGRVAGKDTLAATKDGGATWANETVSGGTTGRTFWAFDFHGTASAHLGLAWGDPYEILSVKNGGAWSQTPAPPPPGCGAAPEFSDVRFSPSGVVAYAATGWGHGCGAIYRGTLAGGTWTWLPEYHECNPDPPPAIQPPCPRSNPADLPTKYPPCTRTIGGAGYAAFQALFGLWVEDDEHALAVGYASLHARKASPLWLDITDHQYFSTAPVYTIAGTHADEAWIFGSFGDIRHVPSVTGVLGFLGDTTLHMAGSPPIATPVVGSRPYETLGPQHDARLGNIVFFNTSTGVKGFATGEFGRIMSWDQARGLWVPVRGECTDSANLFGITMGTENRGVAVGTVPQGATFPLVFGTTDGGTSWVAPQSWSGPTPGTLRSVASRPQGGNLRGKEYWAVGLSSSAVRLQWNGTAWSAQSFPAPLSAAGLPTYFSGIAFVDADHAIAVGLESAAPNPPATGPGVVWRLDATTTQWQQVTNVPAGLPEVFRVTSAGGLVWAVGDGGIVLHSSDSAGPTPSFGHVPAAEGLTGGLDLFSVASVLDPATLLPEVLIGGSAGRMLRSVDGTSWVPLDPHVDRPISSISLPLPGNAWALCRGKQFNFVTDTLLLHYP